jgi:6-phosphogluconolactonase
MPGHFAPGGVRNRVRDAMAQPKITVLPDPAAVAGAAAEHAVSAARQAIERQGFFTLGLSGGSTPRALYQLLAAEPFVSRIHWPAVEVYFGDERAVPPNHADSNYRMAEEALLDRVPIAEKNVHRMRGELDPEAAAIEYGRMLKERFGEGGGLDLALLGMGEDGHTASLFPGTTALGEARHRAVANFVPRLNAHRITLSAPFLNRSKEVLILVTGAAKAGVLKEVLEGAPDPQRLPIQLIDPPAGVVTWLVDAAAAGM